MHVPVVDLFSLYIYDVRSYVAYMCEDLLRRNLTYAVVPIAACTLEHVRNTHDRGYVDAYIVVHNYGMNYHNLLLIASQIYKENFVISPPPGNSPVVVGGKPAIIGTKLNLFFILFLQVLYVLF